jgi:hypothetical protein
MTRIDVFRSKKNRFASSASDLNRGESKFEKNASIFVFAGLLVVCSLAVGCSNDKPKSESQNVQSPIAQSTPPAPISAPSVPATEPSAKPAPKKIVRKAPATTTYADKTSGVTFQYPRRYVLKTGDDADEIVSASLVPTNFAQPGGVVTAAVAIPEGVYPKSDLVSASFDVSMNKSLTEEQCGEFATVQPAPEPQSNPAQTDSAQTDPAKPATPQTTSAPKLIIGKMELQSAETMGSVESRKEDAKYYHVFENGACYEFALKVATTGSEPDEGGKPVDREEVFKRLEKILASVKINPVEPVKEASAPTSASTTPAQ